jgi:hypothetical protein
VERMAQAARDEERLACPVHGRTPWRSTPSTRAPSVASSVAC